jgi:PEP-CTERM motif
MMRLIWGTAILFGVSATCAYADSVSTFNITQATVFVGAGSDNVSFSLTGPGISILGFGGIQCQLDWCDGQVFPPGSSAPGGFGFDGQIFLGETDVKLGGHDLGDTLDLTPFLALNTSGGFTFPMNPTAGSSFTGCQPAAMPSSFTGSAGSGDDFTNFILQMPTGGKFCSTWDFVPASEEFPAGYQFSQGKFLAATVPEPSTLGLMATGLAGIIGVVRRKRNWRSPV